MFHSVGASGVTATAATSANRIITGEVDVGSTPEFGRSVALGDVTGDGYSDLAVGANGYSDSISNRGRVYVFHSSGSGGIGATQATSANTMITGQAGDDQFGYNVTFGDVNGDGYADLAASAIFYPSGNDKNGAVYVLHSSGSSGIGVTAASSYNTRIEGENTTDELGWNISVGDVNGDWFSDVLTGAKNYNSSTGRAYLFQSTGSGGIIATVASSASIIISGEATSNKFGFSVSLADINGDGFADPVVGAYGYSSNRGRVYVFRSSGIGGVSDTSAITADTIITGENGQDYFGNVLHR